MSRSACRSGTSVISLLLPARSQIPAVSKMLTDEMAAAECIKARVNRASVRSALVSVGERVRRYKEIPANGLAVFCGEVLGNDGRTKKVLFDFEPIKPIPHKLYLCDNRFHTDVLREMLTEDDAYGFIVMDGNSTLIARVVGAHTDILQQLRASLPNKHGRGGQSAPRFGRLRQEKRRNYVRKVAELASTHFLQGATTPRVKGLVVAGSASLKDELISSKLLDPRLAGIVLCVLDVAYGGVSGLNTAILMSAASIHNHALDAERDVLRAYFTAISEDSGLYAVGHDATLAALDQSAVNTLILSETANILRTETRNSKNGVTTVHVHAPEKLLPLESADEVVSTVSLVEWLSTHAKEYGAKVVLVTNNTPEGAQFCAGFGGIGALLRWKVELPVGAAAAVTEVDESDVLAGAGVAGDEEDEEIDFM